VSRAATLLLFTGLSLLIETVPAKAASPPVAIVYALSGGAQCAAPGERPRAAHLFDRLVRGETLEVAPGGNLALAFADGRRYELSGGAWAKIGAAGLAERAGSVRPLTPVPVLPRLAAIAPQDAAMAHAAAAVRIRGNAVTGLYPRHGAGALADGTRLRFHSGGGQYRVEVQDASGAVVFQVDTAADEVRVPAGPLAPGERYHWTVRTLDQPGPEERGEADFATLPAELARQREALRRAVAVADGGAAPALLAAVDRVLGLLAEARDELRAALAASPDDAALRTALADLERQLQED
jgi:hypothetical protein